MAMSKTKMKGLQKQVKKAKVKAKNSKAKGDLVHAGKHIDKKGKIQSVIDTSLIARK